jgi:acyl-CoA hydrolase
LPYSLFAASQRQLTRLAVRAKTMADIAHPNLRDQLKLLADYL